MSPIKHIFSNKYLCWEYCRVMYCTEIYRDYSTRPGHSVQPWFMWRSFNLPTPPLPLCLPHLLSNASLYLNLRVKERGFTSRPCFHQSLHHYAQDRHHCMQMLRGEFSSGWATSNPVCVCVCSLDNKKTWILIVESNATPNGLVWMWPSCHGPGLPSQVKPCCLFLPCQLLSTFWRTFPEQRPPLQEGVGPPLGVQKMTFSHWTNKQGMLRD